MTHSDRVTLERLREVCARRAIGASKHYQDIAAGLWTRPVPIGRASAWPSHETDELIGAQIAGASDDQMRALVQRLHAARGGVPIETIAKARRAMTAAAVAAQRRRRADIPVLDAQEAP